MATISLFVSLAFVVLFSYFLMRMAQNIGQNLLQGRRYRRDLRLRLGALPLERALIRAGTDPNAYLHTRPIHAIAREMHNCADCQANRQCHEALEAETPTEKFAFCPNYTDLFKR